MSLRHLIESESKEVLKKGVGGAIQRDRTQRPTEGAHSGQGWTIQRDKINNVVLDYNSVCKTNICGSIND